MKNRQLITDNDMKAPITEAYKTLRTNIQYSSIDKTMKLIAITSADPSVGKSTTSSNLAISLAESDKKVLLIDCDLRKPSIHKVFKTINGMGLTNILVEDIPYDNVCNNVGIPNLDVITSGPKPPNPSELLGSSRMKALLKQVAEAYDIVILDTPPVLAVTDAAVLSPNIDGIIMVIKYGGTTSDMAIRAKENLDRVNANVIGAVINGINAKSYGYTYYYYDYSSHKKPISIKTE